MRKAVVLGIALALFAGLGCDLFSIPPDTGDGDGDWQPPLSPLAVLEDLEWCYNNANYGLYATLLDEENFTFYFDDEDVGGDIPDSWGYYEEIVATQNLFEGVGAPNIDLVLDFTNSGDTDPDPEDVEFDIPYVSYDLRVVTPDVIYLAQATANFQLSKFQDDDGLVRWWLTLWWDIVV